MSTLPRTQSVSLPLGMLSLVLGTIALLLFFLPVLGVPIAAFALLVGVVATALILLGVGGSLRWALVGSAVSALALAVNLAIFYAPGGYLPDPHVRPLWQPVPGRPSVPPPARPT